MSTNEPPGLAEIQRALGSYLYTARPSDQQETALLRVLDSTQGLAARSGLAVYRRNLVFGLRRALAARYPLTEQLLGAENFSFFAREHIYAYPALHHDLDRYGERFPELLAGRNELADQAWLADVAHLEWAWGEVGRAQPSVAVRGDRLLQLTDRDSPTVVLRPVPSLLRLRLQHDVFALWRALVDGEELDDEVVVRATTNHVVLWHSDRACCAERVSNQIGILLEAIARGANLGQIEQRLSVGDSNSPTQQMQQMLAFVVEMGWISATER